MNLCLANYVVCVILRFSNEPGLDLCDVVANFDLRICCFGIANQYHNVLHPNYDVKTVTFLTNMKILC